MTHGELRLYIQGHRDKLNNDTCNAIIGGYYSAYYSWGKNAKPLDSVLSGIMAGGDSTEERSIGTVDLETAKRIDEMIASGKMKLKGG